MALKNFTNSVTKTNRIYSKEDIGKMSTKEFSDNEKSIDYQLKTIGIPSNIELLNSEDVIYVNAYTKDDGTEVKGHYRSKPDKINSNNLCSESKNISTTEQNVKNFNNEYTALTKLFGNKYTQKINDIKNFSENMLQKSEYIKNSKINTSSLVVETIAIALKIVSTLFSIYKNGKLIYNKLKKNTYHPLVPNLDTAIEALEEIQQIKTKKIDLLTKGVSVAKNQEEHTKFYHELMKQREQRQKQELLLVKIKYSIQQKDYVSVSEYLNEYKKIEKETTDVDFEQFENSEFKPYKPIFPANDNQENIINFTENLFPKFKKGVNENIDKSKTLIETLLKPINKNQTMGIIYSPVGSVILDLINQLMNDNEKDAADLMQISLYGPENLEPTGDYTPIDKMFNAQLNTELGLTGDLVILHNWYGIVFNKDSHLAQSINNSNQYKEIFMVYFNMMPKKEDIFIISKELDKGFSVNILIQEDPNLFKAIHNASILNPKIENGYFTGVLFDTYDFKFHLRQYFENYQGTIVNNLAWLLQETKFLHNYYLLVPIKIKIN